MKLCRKNQSVQFSNSQACIVTEFPLEDSEINFAIATIRGRYPETGRITNEKCKELVYIQQGQGEITIENELISLQAGDTLLIDRGERFFWQGEMTLLVACTPTWFKEQHIHIEEVV